jgi:uncharacterized membrane protein SpoIIM required for sporulation
MNERDFVNKKRADWDRLAALISQAVGQRGVRGLSREDVRQLGPLYRRVSSDLAYARLHATNSDLIAHLNGLVGRAHALMFEAERPRSPRQSLIHFYANEFPALLQKRLWFFLAATGISVLGGVFAYWLVITHPDRIDLFIPEQLRSSMQVWKEGKVASPAYASFSAQLMTNNQTVGLISFALGPAGGFPSAYFMFSNGAMLGAMAALMTQVHQHHNFWPGILPHGFAELTAIFICGGAGLLMGTSVLFPGRYHRVESFKRAGSDAIKLVLGTIPLFIFAGIIEGMFSHLPIPAAIRLTFAGVNGVLWYLYLFLPRPAGSLPDDDAEPLGN